DHLIHDFGVTKELTFQWATINFQRHGLTEITPSHGANRARDFRCGPDQVVDQHVDGFNLGSPVANGSVHEHSLLELSFLSHCPAEPGHLEVQAVSHRDSLIEGVRNLAVNASPV